MSTPIINKIINAFNSGSCNNEIACFKNLETAINSVSCNITAEVYHGAKSFVDFHPVSHPAPNWLGRLPARCELADLLLISYRKRPAFELRIAFLQAKYDKKKYNHPQCINTIQFKADKKQWYLLRYRPSIKAVNKNNSIPQNILSDAICSTVGAFIVFSKLNNNNNIIFCAADNINPLNQQTTSRYVVFTTSLRCCGNKFRPCSQYIFNENQISACTYGFISSLINVQIGTPIDPSTDTMTNGAAYDSRIWLAGVLDSIAHDQVNRDSLVQDLREALDIDDAPRKTANTTKTIMIIRNDEE